MARGRIEPTHVQRYCLTNKKIAVSPFVLPTIDTPCHIHAAYHTLGPRICDSTCSAQSEHMSLMSLDQFAIAH